MMGAQRVPPIKNLLQLKAPLTPNTHISTLAVIRYTLYVIRYTLYVIRYTIIAEL